MNLDYFFAGSDESHAVFEAVRDAIHSIGTTEVRVSRGQIGFRRDRPFVFAWIPDIYFGRTDIPLVLTIALPRKVDSPRWSQIVEASPGHFMHHLALRKSHEVDAEVVEWLREAWSDAADQR